MREQNDHVLILSGGDCVTTNSAVHELLLQSEVYLELFGQVGVDAVCAQSVDLRSGYDELLASGEKYNIPYMCANLKRDGELMLPGFKVFEFGGKRVGVLSVVDPAMQHSANKMPANFKYEDPALAVGEGVKALREVEGCDAVILMYGARRDKTVEQCADIEGIDLILYGNSHMSQRVPAETAAGTYVYSAAAKGKDFGEIILTINDDGTTDLSPIMIHELDKNYKDDPDVLARVNAYKAEAKERKDRARLIEEMARNFSDTPVSETYLGTDVCARCHSEQVAVFESSAHAGAMHLLEEAGESANVECIGCHVTGWNSAGGYGINKQNRLMLSGVQCEACHGYGTAHERNNLATRTRARELCLDCHTEEQSPDFDFEIYWKTIKH
ncbi:MAG: hypothetical protein GY835_15640 [bacterium]|nr:hypothetical protein [bacterium]